MKLPFSLFLALKYLKPKRSFVSAVTVLTMLGITLGVAVLIVVLAVMTGFDDMHKEHMVKLDSHLKVEAQGGWAFHPDPVLEALDRIPEVKASAPLIEGFVMMTRSGQAVTGVLRGIDPEREKDISDLKQYMVDGEFRLDDESVILGSWLANKLFASVGSVLTVYSPACFVGEDELRLPQELTVTGIFSTDMYDVDSQYMVTSLPTARDVFAIEVGVQSIRVMTDDPYQAENLKQTIATEMETFRKEPDSPLLCYSIDSSCSG